MARPLATLPMQKLPFFPIPIASFLILIGVFSVFSIVTFLCGGFHHNPMRVKEKKTVRLGDKKPVSRLQSNISSKALLMVKMISWRKVQDNEEDEEEIDSDEAVWRRTIIMGERCWPLDFSGKILYDSHGNLLPNSPRDQGRSNSCASLEKSKQKKRAKSEE